MPQQDAPWVIRRIGQSNDYWSNQWGWSSYDEADHFTQDECSRYAYSLPIGGYWSVKHRKKDER